MSNREVAMRELKEFLIEKNFVSSKISEIDSIQMDSIQYIDLIVAIEEQYNIEIPDEFLIPNNIWNLNDLVEIICASSK